MEVGPRGKFAPEAGNQINEFMDFGQGLRRQHHQDRIIPDQTAEAGLEQHVWQGKVYFCTPKPGMDNFFSSLARSQVAAVTMIR